MNNLSSGVALALNYANWASLTSMLLFLASLTILVIWMAKFMTKSSLIWVVISVIIFGVAWKFFWPAFKLQLPNSGHTTTESYTGPNGETVTVEKSQ